MIKLWVGKKQLDSTHIACQKASDAAIATAVGRTTKFELAFIAGYILPLYALDLLLIHIVLTRFWISYIDCIYKQFNEPW